MDNMHTYLAQAPLDQGVMKSLLDDICIPDIIQEKDIAHTNLWMTARSSRSSSHYDPYHNVLCVVSGRKVVKLNSPSDTPEVYPLPVWGDSANHSAVNFESPDFSEHPEYRNALEHQDTVTLEPGDALFIPEGWWHQIDSEGGTIGINFWWRSHFHQLLRGHMGPYFLRELTRSQLKLELDALTTKIDPLTETELNYNTSGTEDSESELEEVEPSPSLASWEPSIPESDPENLLEGNSEENSTLGQETCLMDAQNEDDLHLSKLATAEQRGVTWLASFLCTRVQPHSCQGEDQKYKKEAHPLVRWLQSFRPSTVFRMLCAFSAALPALMGVFWDTLPPVGAYILTDLFEQLEEGGFGEHGIPIKEKAFSQLYGGWEDKAFAAIKGGRNITLRTMFDLAMAKHKFSVLP